MCALGSMIEARGVATAVIGLVRSHLERARPPRALWVPFPLGRPLGEPEDAAFQHRVMGAALGLLERRDGPVVLADFPDDAPSMRDNPAWAPQIALPARPEPGPATAQEWVGALAAELGAVLPRWHEARRRFGRTTVGNARLAPEAWAPFAARFLAGEIPASPVPGLSAAVLVRFIGDDIKALYAEAVQAHGPQPSSAQANRWFWGATLAADFLRALRAAAPASPDHGFSTVGARFLVPAQFVGGP